MWNLLLDAPIELNPGNFGEGLNWIGVCIQAIINFAGNVGLGIILFTLILKLITLPLDIYSKASMRKNSLKMEKMRPQLEKLQKQYQNDQRMYNAKMMELYKKNGYSMFGACLPMIVTLVIFMVVLGAFSSYSQYTNVDVYRKMTAAYSDAVLEYGPENYTIQQPGDPQSVFYDEKEENGKFIYTRTEIYDDDAALVSVQIIKTKTADAKVAESEYKSDDFWKEDVKTSSPYYTIKTDSVLASSDEKIAAAREKIEQENSGDTELSADTKALLVLKQIGSDAAAEEYENVHFKFLWVKNIWLPDVSYKHPVQLESGVPEQVYNDITQELSKAKTEANGYYVLIVISIGTMFLSQLIISKSQKAQNELQTADGRGQKTQKIMMIVLPIMFGIFSFFYSAAFSIYMITSNVFSILSTVLINLVIDKKFKKLEELEIQEKYNKRIPQAKRSSDDTRKGGKK